MNKPFQLWQGDCLRLMSRIPNQSVDLVLCDLPYGTTACKWDIIIPFELLWSHYKRIIKPKGAIVLTASQPFTSILVNSNLLWFRYGWIWDKGRGSNFQNARFQPMKSHEDILVFSKGKTVYNVQWKIGKPYCVEERLRSKNIEGLSGGSAAKVCVTTLSDGQRYPTTILKFNRESDRIHPTQKPVALMEYLIKTYTNPGDLVLDNCMGSGTTGIACARTGRKFIGIEKDPEYFKLAEHRIRIAEKTGMVVGKPEKIKFGFFQ